MSNIKFAAILGVYGKPADRFMTIGYKDDAPGTLDLIDLAGKQGLVEGIEIGFGVSDALNAGTKKEIHSALEHNGLKLISVDPNLWGERRWYKGTLGAADARIRQQAIDHIRQAMDVAAELGCDFLNLWPGQDGFDYMFEVDYQHAYECWVENMQKLADHNPQVRLGLEYKPFEPRTHSTISTYSKTLLMTNAIDRKNVGITVDVGHSLYTKDNLGEVVAITQLQNKLFHLHINDNYSDWDWDMNFGSVHLYDFLEMFYWLKRTHYKGWAAVDIFAYRTPGAESVAENIHWMRSMIDLVDQVGQAKIDSLLAAGDPIQTSRFLRELIFSKK